MAIKTYRSTLTVDADAVLSFEYTSPGRVSITTETGVFDLPAHYFGGAYGGDLGWILIGYAGDASWMSTPGFNGAYEVIE